MPISSAVLTQTGVLCYNTSMQRGQALLEYVLVLACLAVVVSVLWCLVGGASRFGSRAETLVSSEYP